MPGRNVREMARMAAGVEAFVQAGAIHFVQGVVQLNNEGGGGAPPAPVDKHELRGSPRVTINSPSRERPAAPPLALLTHADVARSIQLGGFDLGDVIWVAWIAEHANIIEPGRRPDRTGRMIGSLQAPDGWVWPAIETMLVRIRRWRYQPTAAELPA